MNLSLDYDNTYTRDPIFWDNFVNMAKAHGHTVYCVTMRYPSEGDDVQENLGDLVEAIYFTSRQAKRDYMFKQGISIDVWIDDIPFFIDHSATS